MLMLQYRAELTYLSLISTSSCQKVVAFNSTSAWLTMQSTVLARAVLSVCLSVALRYCVQTNEDTTMRCGFQHLVGQSL